MTHFLLGCRRQQAGGSRQEAGGMRQEAGGRSQDAGGRTSDNSHYEGLATVELGQNDYHQFSLLYV